MTAIRQKRRSADDVESFLPRRIERGERRRGATRFEDPHQAMTRRSEDDHTIAAPSSAEPSRGHRIVAGTPPDTSTFFSLPCCSNARKRHRGPERMNRGVFGAGSGARPAIERANPKHAMADRWFGS
jgi:hypothetical protein